MTDPTLTLLHTPESILKQAVALQRSCSAILIPDGVVVDLQVGQVVYVTQVLGGHFTVQADGRLFRIWEQDADVLGVERKNPDENLAPSEPLLNEAAVKAHVWDLLKTCYDPEIPVNVVDLGLVYECLVETQPLEPAPQFRVVIQMTLTAPGCGMGPVLVEEMKYKILQLPNVASVDVQLIFDPPWHQGLMSEVAKLQLGFI